MLLVFVVAALLLPHAAAAQATARGQQAGPVAPEFRLPVLDATTQPALRGVESRDSISLASLRGRPVVLNFWFIGCPPCAEENPRLSRLWESLGGRVHFLGINMQDPPHAVREHLRRTRAVRYPVLFARGSRVVASYGVLGAPTTIVIDTAGRVVGKVFGTIENDELLHLLERAGLAR